MKSGYLCQPSQVGDDVASEVVFTTIVEVDNVIAEQVLPIGGQQLIRTDHRAISKLWTTDLYLGRGMGFAALDKNNVQVSVEEPDDRIDLRFRRTGSIEVDGKTAPPENPGDLTARGTVAEGISSLAIPLKQVMLGVLESTDFETKTLEAGN
jgi:hypothetical protein